ncbi:hypothetical protein BGZ88_012556 [Linnemannia elongata]|nr:hypothetical protein BGZ88_012556 [Linnemannia elongata]
MKFLILYLLMTLAVVFALPTNMEKRGDIKAPKATCQPSTLTWKVRNYGLSNQRDSFELVIRSTYVGRINFGTPKLRKNIRSGDNKFSVNHGASASDDPLTLTYQGSQYNFRRYSTALTLDADTDTPSKEYYYWLCIKV